jgi:hypothetical protein
MMFVTILFSIYSSSEHPALYGRHADKKKVNLVVLTDLAYAALSVVVRSVS